MKSYNALMTIGLLFSLTACDAVSDASKYLKQTKHYPDEVRLNFINSCSSAGESIKNCQCKLEVVESELSVEEFAAEEVIMVSTGLSDVLTKVLAKAQLSCL